MRIPWIDLEHSVESSRLTISPDGSRVAATNGLWDTRSGVRLAVLPRRFPVDFSRDSRTLLIGGGGLYDARSGELVHTLPRSQLTDLGPVTITAGPTDAHFTVRFAGASESYEVPFEPGTSPSVLVAPDGAAVITAASAGRIASHDIHGECRWERRFDALSDDWYENHFELAFVGGGRVLRLSSEHGGRQRFLDAETGAIQGDFAAPESLDFDSFAGNWLGIAEDRHAVRFVSETRAVVFSLERGEPRELPDVGAIRPPLAISTGLIAVAVQREVSLINRENLSSFAALAAPSARELVFSEDGSLLAAATPTRIRLWRLP